MSFRLKVLNSGSRGNSYLLIDESGETLMLDCGVKANDIKKALNFDFSKVSGVLVTHEHKDHCLAADDLEMYGLDVWKPYLVDGCRDRKTFGKYAVESFELPHDGTDCCGFYIRHTSGFKMLYLTDLEYCPYVFKKLNIDFILCEVNWQKDYVDDLARNYRHKVLGHFSLENCLEFLKVNKTDKLRTVIICHTSGYTMDVTECVEKIKEVVGSGVQVKHAMQGKVIEL